MNNKTILLLKTMLLSTSRWNMLKYTGDKKKRKKLIISFCKPILFFSIVMGLSIALCIGYGKTGRVDDMPVLSALIISILAFVLTLLQTNGYLFNFKEYDMLMSLPYTTGNITACKLMYAYPQKHPQQIRCCFWFLVLRCVPFQQHGVVYAGSDSCGLIGKMKVK